MASKNGDFKDWRIVRVEDVTTSFSGGTPSRGKSHLFGGSIPWLKSGEINSRVIRTTEETLSEEGLAESAAKWAKAGTVVGAMYGATAGTFGWLDIDTTVNQAVLVIDGKKDEADNRFLLHALTESAEQLLQTVQGSGQPNLNSDLIRKLKLLLPPLSSQKKIASILDSVDEAIEATRAVIDQTRRLKTALLQDLLTNGLRKGAHKKDTLKGIGKVPSHWHLRTVGQLIASGHILEVQDGNHGNDHPKESDFVVAGIPFVAANCIRDGKLYPAMFKFITEDQASSLRIGHARQGDLILTHKGSVGLTAYVDPPFDRMVLTPQTTYYRVDQSKLVRAYLRAYFEDERFQSHLHRLASQSTRDYVGITEQKKLTIPVPPFEEQQLIGTTRDELESKVSSEAECLNTLLLVKSALSQGLLTGRIPVKGAE